MNKPAEKIVPVILSGGSGTRLWPMSRKGYPKQFSSILGRESLYQDCVRRLSGEGFTPPLVLTGEPYRFIVTEQLMAIELDPLGILIEPEGRSTAPAILAAALWLESREPQALMLIAPSDHVIPDDVAFRRAVQQATPRAKQGDLITFGITPDRAETGYGYLELPSAAYAETETAQTLVRFVEKPASEIAEQMVKSGNYLWNSGIFMFSVEAILQAYRTHAAQLVEGVTEALAGAKTDLGFTRLSAEPWADLEDISIDYAIMERADNLAVMPYRGKWSDLGSWDAVWLESTPDSEGNVCSDNATAVDCRDTLLRSETDGLELVGIGLDDIVAIAMADAVLVARKSEAQRVKEAVSRLKARGAPQATHFPRDYRPWGWFDSLIVGDRFQVKQIVVHPGAALSLQSHHHRAEHWIVVAGTARVTVDDQVKLVTENQSIYIPLGAVHRMENPGQVPMVLIEVQTGTYLGEDDIVRYEDVYART